MVKFMLINSAVIFSLWIPLLASNNEDIERAAAKALVTGEVTPLTVAIRQVSFSPILSKLMGHSLKESAGTGEIPSQQELHTRARIYRATLEGQRSHGGAIFVFDLDNTDLDFLHGIRLFLAESRAKTGKIPTVREMEDLFSDLAEDYQFKFDFEVNRNGFSNDHIDTLTVQETFLIKKDREIWGWIFSFSRGHWASQGQYFSRRT